MARQWFEECRDRDLAFLGKGAGLVPGHPPGCAGSLAGVYLAAYSGAMQKSLEAVETIEECLREYTAGWKNSDALSTIAKATHVIEQEAGDSADVRVLLTNLRGAIDTLYSPRKHERYGGADTVTSHILADCSRLRTQFHRLQNSGTCASASSDEPKRDIG